MQITIHIGAHRTDEDRLMKTLMRNSLKLSRHGIFVPGPSRYRNLLRDVTSRLRGETANPETLDLVLDAILDTTEAEHIVLSHESFLCSAGNILQDGGYYARAGAKCAWLRNVFPGHKVRFAIGLRNPATQVPAIKATLPEVRLPDFLAGADPMSMRWAGPLAAIRAAVPDCPLIVWCNEDTPLSWPEIMRAVADHPADLRPKGALDLLSLIMDDEGMARMQSYLASHPPASDSQRRRIYSAFLDKYARDEVIEEVIDMPGWDEALVERMTEAYEEDVRAIEAAPGVTFVAP